MIPLHLHRYAYRLLGVLIFLLGNSGKINASGSYSVRPVHPPMRLVEESRKYELGKAVFLGTAPLKERAAVDRNAQRNLLAGLQERLPPRVKKTVDLPNLSGKLSDEELAALRHFLHVRHKID